MKHALITGGSRGIGAEIVKVFAEAGYAVSYTCRTEIPEKKNNRIFGIRADGRDEEAVKAACRQAVTRFGDVDVLINNAGVSSFQLFQDIDTALWNETMEINVRAPFFYIRTLLPSMISRKCGCILNIASVWGMVGSACEVMYSTAKAALIGMSKGLAKELGPSGIRVNAIAPGYIQTDMNKMLSEETVADIRDQTPIGRVGTPLDIARVALFYADTDTFTTGQVISPNGGLVIV